jgi:hypothetical protein
MHTMESHWDFNIAMMGRHWGRMTWSWNNDHDLIVGKCRTVMQALGPEFTYSLTLWQGTGSSVNIPRDGLWSDPPSVV